jgi:hypothetical protein
MHPATKAEGPLPLSEEAETASPTLPGPLSQGLTTPLEHMGDVDSDPVHRAGGEQKRMGTRTIYRGSTQWDQPGAQKPVFPCSVNFSGVPSWHTPRLWPGPRDMRWFN